MNNKVIYKYTLDFDFTGNIKVNVPLLSYLLKVGVQENQIVLWYLVDTCQLEEKYTTHFKVIMTGEEFDDNGLEYIDTVTLKDWLVCHLFVVIP